MLPTITYPTEIKDREAFLLESDKAIDLANTDIIARLIAVRDSKAWDYPDSPYSSYREWAGERHGFTDPHRKITVAGVAESIGIVYEKNVIDSHLYPLRTIAEPEVRKKVWTALETASKVTAPTVEKIVTLSQVDENTFELLEKGQISLGKAAEWVDTLKGLTIGIKRLIKRHDLKLLLVKEPEIVQQLKLIELSYPEEFKTLIVSGHVPVNGRSVSVKNMRLHDLLKWKTRLQSEAIRARAESSDTVEIDVINMSGTGKVVIDCPFNIKNPLKFKEELKALLTNYK